MSREMFRNLAREPYDPNMSAAITTPPVNLTASTDVPVTMGVLHTTFRDNQIHLPIKLENTEIIYSFVFSVDILQNVAAIN